MVGLIAKGAMKMMALAKMKVAAVVLAGVAVVAGMAQVVADRPAPVLPVGVTSQDAGGNGTGT